MPPDDTAAMQRLAPLLCALALSLGACKKSATADQDVGHHTPEPSSVVINKPIDVPKKRLPFEEPPVAQALPGTNCSVAPSWTRLVPCIQDDWIYAMAEAPVGINPSLGRSQAGHRARWALAEILGLVSENRARLKGAEVPELFICEGTIYALARMRAGRAELPGCGTTLASHAIAAQGCPQWTRGLSWSDDEGLVGVAEVDSIRSPSLARSSVLGRAKSAAMDLVELKLSVRDDKITAFSQPKSVRTLDQETAQCGTSFWGRVRIEPL